MTGRTVNINGRRVRHGLVRFMKDSVRLKNFWRSIAAEQLGYAPKAQWIAPESAVEGRENDFRKAHLSRDPLLVYNDGAEVTSPADRTSADPTGSPKRGRVEYSGYERYHGYPRRIVGYQWE
jgi:hypothetical protein